MQSELGSLEKADDWVGTGIAQEELRVPCSSRK